MSSVPRWRNCRCRTNMIDVSDRLVRGVTVSRFPQLPKYKYGIQFNPLSPHDALKHHFTFLKAPLIYLQLRVLGGKLHENYMYDNFLCFFTHVKLSSSTISRELRKQFAACGGWRWQWKIQAWKGWALVWNYYKHIFGDIICPRDPDML